MIDFEEVVIRIRKCEKIRFEKGMLLESSLTRKKYLVKVAKYLGNGKWEIIKKEVIEE